MSLSCHSLSLSSLLGTGFRDFTYFVSNNNPEDMCYFFHFQENQGSERLLLAQIHLANN